MTSARGSLRLAQLRTIALLFGGYAACYYCRADLSVATPLLVEELGRHGVSHGDALIRIGSVSSLGRSQTIRKYLPTPPPGGEDGRAA